MQGHWRSQKVRRSREAVEPLLRMLLAEFATANPKGPSELFVAGSWRRGATEVGDLDVVVVNEEGSLASSLLSPGVLLPESVKWDRSGDRIAQGTLPIAGEPVGLHVDLWACNWRQFGGMMTFATGPHDLNIRQRSAAKRKGLALSQNGVFDRESGEQLDDGSEEDVYRVLGLKWLTPSERQRWAAP